jgi:hypothetical protein
MVVQRLTDFADRVAERLLAAVASSPDLFDQRFPGDECARTGGQTKQHFHRLWRQMYLFRSTSHLSLHGVDEQISQIKSL